MIKADFAAAAVLISFSALVGKVRFVQLFVFGTLEVVFYSLNLAITYGTFKHSDVGGGITIMVFGAFFGIAATWFFKPKDAFRNERGGRGSYSSQAVAMFGTLFLFMYWPSFNAALVNGVAQ
jgi:ammonium transporter Rh